MNILMILLGGNNIANYALIKYFKENGGIKIDKFDKVVLVHTDFSSKSVNIIKELIDDVEYITIKLENESNIQKVIENIKDGLSNLDISAIHLNYTGGRKPMSLGSFLAVEDLKNSKNIEVVYSDIDPKTYKLTLFNGEVFPTDETSLSDNIELNIKEIFKLHGNNEPVFENSVSEFYSEEIVKFLINKNIAHIRGEDKSFYEIWDSKNIKNTNWQDTIKDFFDVSSISNKKLKKLQEFIRGRYLEEYIFTLLMDLKDELNLTDIGWNVKNGKDAKFEIDVFVVKGYKVYTFSCTTDNKKSIVKSKLFEAIYRAEQTGGIRNTPISISFANEETIKELQEDLVKGDKPFTTFIGEKDLLDENILKNRLREVLK